MDAIRELMSPDEPTRTRIGFEAPPDESSKSPKARGVQVRKSG
jgi:hypothetical protein